MSDKTNFGRGPLVFLASKGSTTSKHTKPFLGVKRQKSAAYLYFYTCYHYMSPHYRPFVFSLMLLLRPSCYRLSGCSLRSNISLKIDSCFVLEADAFNQWCYIWPWMKVIVIAIENNHIANLGKGEVRNHSHPWWGRLFFTSVGEFKSHGPPPTLDPDWFTDLSSAEGAGSRNKKKIEIL